MIIKYEEQFKINQTLKNKIKNKQKNPTKTKIEGWKWTKKKKEEKKDRLSTQA